MGRRAIVVGAGPMGLEAALLLAARGCDVTVLEAGAVGASLLRWGPTRFFTPLAMNLSARARALVPDAPPPDALLTGPELAARLLAPLASSALLAGRVRTGERVLAIGRARLKRDELPGHPLRGERPFRLLVATAAGERVEEADLVLDASGVYQRPLPFGAGGLPAPGEAALGERVIRHLGTLAERAAALAGRRVLLVGHGHSAAHALAQLDALGASGTQTTWAIRSAHARPVVDVASDPLPERAAVVARANALAAAPPAHLTIERRAHVEAVAPDGEALAVTLSGGRRVLADTIVALTGYRPALGMLRALALEIAPATEGAARLARALAHVTDCLTVPKVAAADLASGEPGFALVGAKSYGRARSFLLQTGLAQLEAIVAAL